MLKMNQVSEEEIVTFVNDVFRNQEINIFVDLYNAFESDFCKLKAFKKIPWHEINNAHIYREQPFKIRPANKNPDRLNTYIYLLTVYFNDHYFYVCLYLDINKNLRLYIPKKNNFNPLNKMPGGINNALDIEYFLSQRKQDSDTYTMETESLKHINSKKTGYPRFYRYATINNLVSISDIVNEMDLKSSLCNIRSRFSKINIDIKNLIKKIKKESQREEQRSSEHNTNTYDRGFWSYPDSSISTGPSTSYLNEINVRYSNPHYFFNT